MNSKRFWGTVMAACLTVSLLAQQHKSVIPYKLVGQKMIIEMLVNGQPRPFVFDTGGRNALITEAPFWRSVWAYVVYSLLSSIGFIGNRLYESDGCQ